MSDRPATPPRHRHRVERPRHGSRLVPSGGAGRITVVGLILGAVATMIGVALLWPTFQDPELDPYFAQSSGSSVVTERGEVVSTEVAPCGSPDNGRVLPGPPLEPRFPGPECPRSIVRLDTGPDAGRQVLLEIPPGPGSPDLGEGDQIQLGRSPQGATDTYAFEDFTRTVPMALWLLVGAVVMVAVGRWKGLRALIGIAVALVVVVGFVLPSILDGNPAILVAVVGGSAVLYLVIYVVHGINLKTHAALLGTLSAMLAAALLSWVVIETTRITGLSGDSTTQVQVFVQHVSLTGLLLAGFIIGALGVLNDVTVSQSATVFEMRHLDPHAGPVQVFRSAMGVGRDHVASMVYTLVLAYTGSALPLLLLFSLGTRSPLSILTSDVVAVELMRSLVGAIALALCVPLTTAAAVWLSRDVTPEELDRATVGARH
ncbi:MAG: YibE/F family protein [Dietzia sp.]|uniref:YibE/F family protein n=1 Tax=Dietzia TaxID=37914 RepID=UPI0015CB6E30|nr:YibE/F family protein [Dietzia sp.]MBB1034409.1 YibE/F family protein [Dietzia sp. CQ4]MBB1039268.1 YibE/F family protein [Dietzia natronolimnaea]MBB1040727.1 YibE/F family protein [Dietzia sp. Cai40]MBB1044035.1 YibE/F family protein [Dietzia sp. DQ11-44]MBB1048081.1 YibE/F family protein [Dietzia cercidiphylli]MBB1050148.1 YibE/F family protein [Dietzia sp. CW19]MBB1053957.1 YibE/F family protein [Dietzia sp. B44]MBB1057062.1 YibE/F family protein [Dietzia sp. B19]